MEEISTTSVRKVCSQVFTERDELNLHIGMVMELRSLAQLPDHRRMVTYLVGGGADHEQCPHLGKAAYCTLEEF